MKLNRIDKGIYYAIACLTVVFVLVSCEGYACERVPANFCSSGKIYLGIFGGTGSSTEVDISQYGTAYYFEINGGPLAVDAFGKSKSRSADLVGGHVGYQWAEIFPNPCNPQWSLTPAVEWEGYYIGKSSFTAHDINNNTSRLPEHDFLVTYPIKTGVFLTNAILNINPGCLKRFHPYVGAGIGAAVVSVSNATAEQVAPPEPGINHYNSNPNDSESVFAAQTKVGLNLDLSRNISMFVEYRWLYLPSTHFAFGSTVYPGHPATDNWLVNIDRHYYNMGAIGLQYRI